MRRTKKFLLGILVVGLFLPMLATTAQEKKAVIDISHNEYAAEDCMDLKKYLETIGYSVYMADSGITSSVLSGAQLMFVPAPFTSYTSAELDAVKAWFDEGGKAIWVTTDSDYGGNDDPSNNANAILEKIGSVLRVEPTSVEDPDKNDGAAYRVMATNPNPDTEITAGVSQNVFHGPTCIYAVVEGQAVALETEIVENVTWIMKTSPSGIITDASLQMPAAHENGEKGSLVMMAVEKFAGVEESSKVVASGEAIFRSYKQMFSMQSEHGQSVQGETLVKNTITWMELVEEAKGVGVSVLVALSVIGIGYLIKRK